MRFNIHINQPKALEWGLTLTQAAMFNFCYGLQSWADTIQHENEVYYFASRNMIIKEMPLITDKVDTVYRTLINLKTKGLIQYIKVGKKDFIKVTKKGAKWNKVEGGNKSELQDNAEINPKTLGNKSELDSEINPTYNNSILDNNSILKSKKKEGAQKESINSTSAKNAHTTKKEEKKKEPTGAKKEKTPAQKEFYDKVGKKQFEAFDNLKDEDRQTLLDAGTSFLDSMTDWLEFKRERKEAYTNRGINEIIKAFKKYGAGSVIEAWEVAIRNGAKGYYPKIATNGYDAKQRKRDERNAQDDKLQELLYANL